MQKGAKRLANLPNANRQYSKVKLAAALCANVSLHQSKLIGNKTREFSGQLLATKMNEAHIATIKSLPIWTASIVIAPLSGGLNNSNYLVTHSGARYVVRIENDLHRVGVRRDSESKCMTIANQCNISPRLVHHQSGVMVTEFVEGRELKIPDAKSSEIIELFARVLKTLHSADVQPITGIPLFSPFQLVEDYARKSIELAAPMSLDLNEALACCAKLKRQFPQPPSALCHNDLFPTNWLFDGKRLWLLDWEYAGIGSPKFDLGNLAANFRFDPAMEEHLLLSYGTPITHRVKLELKAMKSLELLRGFLWGAIRAHTTDVDADFQHLLVDQLSFYHATRKELDQMFR